MATASSTPATSNRSGGGGASADSYIGSLISLTSKSEIRYEGVLYNINTEESSIGLRNVKSFGTEGRKKDGPQVPPSDKVYEYILFRGSDIKDLQVKASPPVQTTPINSDPAIIQSHYPRPTAPPANLPPAPSGSLPDHGSHSTPMGLPRSSFQGGPPLYQPGGNMNSWDPSPNANNSSLAMPMYWQGFYGTPNGLPQQSLLRPPPVLSIPPSMQQMQFSGFNSSLPTAGTGFNSSLPTAGTNLPTSNLPDVNSSLNPTIPSSSLTSTLPASTLPLNLPSLQHASSASETMINPLPNKYPITALPTSTPSTSLASLSLVPSSVPDKSGVPVVPSKLGAIAGPAALPQQTISQPGISISGASISGLTESPTPSLITPGQLMHSGAATISATQPLQAMQKDVEVVQVSSDSLAETSVPAVVESQPPILPLPTNSRVQKPNGGVHHTRNNYSNYRGRGGRGYGISRPVMKFTEDFDFMAMNEKFNKDEVWGHLGKSSTSQSKDKELNGSGSDEDYSQYQEDVESPKIEIKSNYNKDDFFDSISCNALDNDPSHGRTRYSEQMKLDTETFGDFSRYRGGRGGRPPFRGGGRFRGSYHGRGGYGGYGYMGRGRGRGIYNHAS